MLARVVIEVDQLARRADSRERSVDGLLDGRDERDDGTIVREIRGRIENRDTLDGSDGVTNSGNNLGPPALGEIGNALDETHRRLLVGGWLVVRNAATGL